MKKLFTWARKKRKKNWFAKRLVSLEVSNTRLNRWRRRNKRFACGMDITAFYLGLMLVVVGWHWLQSGQLGPNEIGDMLAGIFGPVAFLWLILGYLQQGDELKQNTEAVHGQREELALNRQTLLLQAQELKASVEQQTLLATQARIEYENKLSCAVPLLSWPNAEISRSSGGGFYLEFHLKNEGMLVFVRSIDLVDDENIRCNYKSSINKSLQSGSKLTQRIFCEVSSNSKSNFGSVLIVKVMDSMGQESVLHYCAVFNVSKTGNATLSVLNN